jgi:hypothetical protein
MLSLILKHIAKLIYYLNSRTLNNAKLDWLQNSLSENYRHTVGEQIQAYYW